MNKQTASPTRRRLRIAIQVAIALPALAALYVYGQSASHAARARHFDDWWSRPQRIYHFTGYQARGWMNLLSAHSLKKQLDDAAPDAGQLRLHVPRAGWDRIALDPQAAFGRDFDATLVDGSSSNPVKLRVRGDTSAHWTTDKISFTLRTPKDQQWRSHQTLGFSCKRVLEQYVSGRLAREFGLLAPWTTVAPVYLNDSYHGLYRVLELVDESFLRSHGRLPGNIHRGDTAERGEVFKNVPRALMRNPYIWDRTAKDNRGRSRARARIEALVRDLHDTSLQGRQQLWSHFDRREISRLFALLFVVGDSFHISDIHNHFWYQDPTDQRLHPIPWDVYVSSLHQPISTYNLLLKELLRDPAVLEGALRHVRDQVEHRDLAARVERIPAAIEDRFAEAFAFDRLRRGWISDVGSADEIASTLRDNLKLLARWTEDARIRFCAGPADSGTAVLDLVSEGLAGCDLLALRWERGLPPGATVDLRIDRNRNGRSDAEDPVVVGELTTDGDGAVFTLAAPVALMAGTNTDTLPLQPAVLPYRMFVQLTGAGPTDAPRPLLRNRLTGSRVTATPLDRGALLFDGEAWHPWDAPVRTPATTRWRGEVRLDETVEIPAGERLVIEPGTTVRLGPDVSIVARGAVEAHGTAEAPIEFVRRGKKLWGTLALLGEGAAGSSFTHCRFRRGGGATVKQIECKGMVTVHNTSGIAFSRCEFSANGRCDDTLHAARSEVSVSDCLFSRAYGDAIDFEISTGEILDCRFDRPANDAIDLMTSDPLIAGNVMIGCGDKGISVGEVSNPLIFNNVIRDGARGIEIREGSEPSIVHNTIEGNRVGLRMESEHWRYQAGGVVVVARTTIKDNDTDLKIHRNSRLVLTGSALGTSSLTTHVDPEADLVARCLLADRALRVAPGKPGATGDRAPAAPGQLVEAVNFRGDFEQVADGWHAVGPADGPAKRQRDLVLTLADDRAAMERDIAWDTRDSDRRHVVLMEVAVPGCRDAAIEVERVGGTVTVPIPTGGPGFRLITVELDPGEYSTLRISATPDAGRGRIALHGYRRYALAN